MSVYRALKSQAVQVPGGVVDVAKGTLVDFPADPGAGWEKVKNNGSNPRPVLRDLDDDGQHDSGDEGGV